MQDEDFQAFQRQLRAEVEAQNSAPLEEFLGLSPIQMMGVNRQPLEEGCVLRWQDNIAPDTLAQVPLLTFAVDLMEQLRAKPIKLTAKGNLPAKLVKAWYATGLIPQYGIETGFVKLRSEDDYYAAKVLKLLLGMLGWTKKRHGKLSLTVKGTKALAGPRQALLQELFAQHFTRFNLAYFDGYDDEGQMQHFFGFLLVALLKKGTEYRPTGEYPELMLRAFPMLAEDFPGSRFSSPQEQFSQAAISRFFEGSLNFYGLLRYREAKKHYDDAGEVMASDLFRQLFRLDLTATKPQPPGYEDAQIRSALFDAEMGSTSWTSGDLPPEMQQLFQDQIRAFHAQDGAGRVTIGSLVPNLEIKDPDSFRSPEEAIAAIREVLEALRAEHVLFEPPPYLPPPTLYRFLVTDLLRHEIPKPSLQLPAFVPAEEVDSELLAEPPETVFVAEAFLISLLTLEEPLPEDLFHQLMRLGDEVVPRAAALAHASHWRKQWTTIRPLSFAPGPSQEQDSFTYQFVQCAFETTDQQGSPQTHEWTGVVQLLRVGEAWKVYGGHFEGEGSGFGF